MKPETKRLLILDVIIAVVCGIQFFKGVAPWMWLPVLVAQLTLLAYGLWFLGRMWIRLS